MKSSTQDFLEIQDIREGVLILKNNQIRGILMVSSMNFALKSQEEQSATIYAFQDFLNSLDFTCQILVQSRKINITPYLDSIKNLKEHQPNELLRAQISSYASFIKDLVQGDSIMTKNFYVSVPYNLAEIFGTAGAIKKSAFGLFSKKNKDSKMSQEDFERVKNQLWQRMEYLAMGLKRCGLDIMPLTTPELIELFWAIHHPSEAEVGYYPSITPELLS